MLSEPIASHSTLALAEGLPKSAWPPPLGIQFTEDEECNLKLSRSPLSLEQDECSRVELDSPSCAQGGVTEA